MIIQEETTKCQVVDFAVLYDKRVNTLKKYRGSEAVRTCASERYLTCYRSIGYNAFYANKKIGGKMDCGQN